MKVNRVTQLLCFLFLLISAHSFDEGSNGGEQEVKRSDFPNGFLFGVTTSSYQIEGAFLEDGKSLSNWDVFYPNQSSKLNGQNAEIADDHYHLYMKDIEMMHSLGIDAYRFSISWARVLPRGRLGEVNPNGIMFYNKIIDNLLLKGIKPFVTIHHLDFPQELEDRYGSWLSPLMQEEFVHFANTCFDSFGDRVKLWVTINEPNLVAESAYLFGLTPPAHCSEPFGNCSAGNSDLEPLTVVHNMLLAHGKAVKLYRQRFKPKQGGFIGIVASCSMYEPLTDNELDREAAIRALAFNVGWNLDPLIFGDYPPEMRHYHGSELPSFSHAEKKCMKGSIDFIGINHYSTFYAKDCTRSSCNSASDRAIQGYVDITVERDGVPIGEPMGIPGFLAVPRGIGEIIDYLKKRYHNLTMFVVENGYSAPEQQEIQLEDILEDAKRIEFHKAYLSSLAQAIRNGADVRGYFLWTLMDAFEWVTGYEARFGLYYVDHQTLNRIPKLSARWYQSFLSNRSLNKENAVTLSELVHKKADIL